MNTAVTFGRPELVPLGLLAPLLAAALVWLWVQRVRAAREWGGPVLWRRLLPGYRGGRQALWVALLALAALGVAGALARPRWGMEEREVRASGVDVVVVLDSSLSMSATDVTPDRLTVAKILLRRLLAGIAGHRVALVQSEGEGQILSPLTLDHGVIDLLLDTVEPASLPTPGTRLASGLEQAIESLPSEGDTRGVVVVISDGEDHGSDWSAAAAAAERAGIVVHAIGVATREGAPLRDADGRPKVDPAGRPVVSRLQAEPLERIAAATGGVYLEAAAAGADVASLAGPIASLAAATTASATVRQARERFPWLLAPATACLLAALALGPFAGGRRRR